MNKPIIYTIGHSTHQLNFFLELLKIAEINCIVDVRSVPASAHNPQYNQDALKNFLKNNNITYLHFAKEFGARQTDYNLLDNEGRLDFVKFRKTEPFHQGVKRIRQGINNGFKIAIMCSESEPLDCHRFSMVSIGLENDGFEVRHILKDKSIKTNLELEKELLKKYGKKISQNSLFDMEVSIEIQLNEALILKNKEIGFSSRSIQREQEEYD
jgi:uncharacterized protein (DUF488 family)